MSNPQERMIPPYQSTDGLSDLRRKLAASRAHVAGKVMTEEEILDAEYFTERVALGVAQGFELLMTDDRLINSFWQRGYESFVNQSSSNARRWAGTGFFYALVFSLCVWGASWVMRNNGAIKP